MGASGVRREAHEVMHQSCIVPNIPASGGSVIIWGRFSWSGLGSATLWSNKMKSAEYLNVLNDYIIPSMDFFLPWQHSHIFWPGYCVYCKRMGQGNGERRMFILCLCTMVSWCPKQRLKKITFGIFVLVPGLLCGLLRCSWARQFAETWQPWLKILAILSIAHCNCWWEAHLLFQTQFKKRYV